jgi:beta-carotene hydroxylase
MNDVLLCMIELLALRSGHAYQMAHLHHHARYPADDDIEASAARKTFLGAVLEGFTFQPRIWWWAFRRGGKRAWVVGEGTACLALVVAAAALTPLTVVVLAYAALMIAGSWIIPLVTSYIPHTPGGAHELSQTRLFRGTGASIVALQHLYHLEHHLYPAVPHQNWPKLARRLDRYFQAAGVRPVKIWL